MRLMQLKRFGRGMVFAAATASMSVGAGCKKDTPAEPPVVADVGSPAPEADKPVGDSGGEVARPRAGLEPAAAPAAPVGLFASRTLRFAPASTRVAVVANFANLFKGLGAEATAGVMALDGMFGSMLGAAKEHLALDISDPASFGRAGIAIDKDFSFALLSDDDDSFMLGFELTDVAAFTSWFEGIMKNNGKTLAKDVLGDATILMVEGEKTGAILVTETAAWLLGMGQGGDTPELARKVHAGGGGLTANPDYARAVGQLPAVSTGVFFSKEHLQSLVRPYSQVWIARAEKELQAAKDGKDPEAIAAAERELGSAKESAQWDDPSNAGLQKLLAPATGLAMGLGLGEREAIFSAFLGLPDDATLKRVAVPGGAFRIARLIDDTTLLAYAAHVSPRDYLGMMLGMLGAEAEIMSELKSSLASFLQIDLESDVLGQLTGEIGVSVSADTAALGAFGEGGNPMSTLDIATVIGIRDGARVETLLQKLLSLEVMQGSGAFWNAEEKRLNMPVPGAVVHVAVAEGALVATNQSANLERLKSTDAGSLAGLVSAGVVKEALASPKLAGFVMFSAAMLEPVITRRFTFSLEFGLWPPAPIDDDASEADKAAFEALNAAYEAARAERRAATEAVQAWVRKLLNGLGKGVQTLEVVDGGLKLHYGQFMPATTTLGTWLGEAMGFMSPDAMQAIEAGPAQKKYEAMRSGEGGEQGSAKPSEGEND